MKKAMKKAKEPAAITMYAVATKTKHGRWYPWTNMLSASPDGVKGKYERVYGRQFNPKADPDVQIKRFYVTTRSPR